MGHKYFFLLFKADLDTLLIPNRIDALADYIQPKA